MSSTHCYARLDPVPVMDDIEVIKLFRSLVSDAEIIFTWRRKQEHTFLGFQAEDSVHWEDAEGPITELLERMKPYIEQGYAAVYKEVHIREDHGDTDFEAFAWKATRDSLTSVCIDSAPGRDDGD